MKKNKPKPVELPIRLQKDLAVVQSPQLRPTTVKHSVNLGDVVASLSACCRFWELTGRQIVFAQTIGFRGQYYPGAVHPTVDKDGFNVCVNEPMFDMIKPLVEAQPYIAKMEPYTGQPIDLDFDVIRQKTFVNLPHGSIQAWLFYAYPDLAYDLTKPWLVVGDDCPESVLKQVKGKIILNFTERYRNELMDYNFLQSYAPDLIFAGTEREHWLFCQRWRLNIPRLEINNFLEYAQAIKTARFMLCNQSLGWQIAEAIKSPRILEVCAYAQNCLPFYGEDSLGYFHQTGLEYYFRTFYNKTLGK